MSITPTLLSKDAVLGLLGVSDRTLEKLVRQGKFPPPLRLGKTVRWAESVVHRWLQAQLEAQFSWESPRRSGKALRPTDNGKVRSSTLLVRDVRLDVKLQ